MRWRSWVLTSAKFQAIPVVALVFFLAAATPSHIYQHGTVVFTLASPGGFVMAADGLTLFLGARPGEPLFKGIGSSKPKIAVCGHTLLCGMAGVNPFPNELKIKYDFGDWISSVGSERHFSPQSFSEAINAKAQLTFKDFGFILKTDAFWRSSEAPHDLLDFQVVGYDGKIPQVCKLRIEIDRQHDRLIYRKPECLTPLWGFPKQTSVLTFPLSLGDCIPKILMGGTPEEKAFGELLPTALASARVLVPSAPTTMQTIVGEAAAFVGVTDKFHPDRAGGVTTIGVLQEGSTPIVFQFPD